MRVILSILNRVSNPQVFGVESVVKKNCLKRKEKDCEIYKDFDKIGQRQGSF